MMIQVEGSNPITQIDAAEVPVLGISLRGINAFISSVGGKKHLATLTTSEVVRKYLMPQTAAQRGLSFCEQHDSDEFIQRATVFVSHAWSHNFIDLVDALNLCEHSQNSVNGRMYSNSEEYYWLDFFCNCQHTAPVRPFAWWATTFANAIAAIGKTTLVLGFDDPKPLSRAWCLFEIMCSSRSAFSVAVSHVESATFAAALADDPAACMEKLARIDLQRAEATKPEDKAAIFAAVTASTGFDVLNKRVADLMRSWTQRAAIALAIGSGPEQGEDIPNRKAVAAVEKAADTGAAIKLVAADWLLSTGDAREALRVLDSTVLNATARFGTHSLLTQQLIAREALARLAVDGDAKKAEASLRGVWAAKRDLRGETDPSTLRSLHDVLSVSLTTSTDDWRALLALQQRVLGASAADTLETVIALSRSLCDARKDAEAHLVSERARDEAEAMLRSALETAGAIAGGESAASVDPLVSSISGALGALLRLRKTAPALSEALPLLLTFLRSTERRCGPHHPDCRIARKLLAASVSEATSLQVVVEPRISDALTSKTSQAELPGYWARMSCAVPSPPQPGPDRKFVIFTQVERGGGWSPAFLCQGTTTGALAEALREILGRSVRKAHAASWASHAGEAFPDIDASARLTRLAPVSTYLSSAAPATGDYALPPVRERSLFYATVRMPRSSWHDDEERRALIAATIDRARGRGIAALAAEKKHDTGCSCLDSLFSYGYLDEAGHLHADPILPCDDEDSGDGCFEQRR